jgi:tripartite-type tricarboxylate transporter receptor subunit TctC
MFIIPDSVSGGASVYARGFASRLDTYFTPKADFEVINDPGADGQKAIIDLTAKKPDGYTIAMLGEVLSVKQGNHMLENLTWIATIGRGSFGIISAQNGDIDSIKKLRDISKSRPVLFSASGQGSLNYFALTLFCYAYKITNYRIVTGYKGSTGSILAVVRGEVDATAESVPTLQKFIKDGFAKMIFMYDENNSLPGVDNSVSINAPALSNVVQWRFVAGPPNMPVHLVKTLSNAFLTITQQPETIAWAEKIGVPLYHAGPEETAQLMINQQKFIHNWKTEL